MIVVKTATLSFLTRPYASVPSSLHGFCFDFIECSIVVLNTCKYSHNYVRQIICLKHANSCQGLRGVQWTPGVPIRDFSHVCCWGLK